MYHHLILFTLNKTYFTGFSSISIIDDNPIPTHINQPRQTNALGRKYRAACILNNGRGKVSDPSLCLVSSCGLEELV